MPTFDDLFPSPQGQPSGPGTRFDDLFPPLEAFRAIPKTRRVLGAPRDRPQTGTLEMAPPGTTDPLDVSAWERLPRMPGEAAVSFSRGLIGSTGAMLQGVGHWAKRLDEALPESLQSYKGKTEEDLVTSKLGQGISRFAGEKLQVSPEFKGSLLAEKLPEALGTTLPLASAGAAGGYATAGATLAGALMNTGVAYEQGKAAGLSKEDARAYADLMGVVGTSEAWPIAKLFGRLSKPVQRLAGGMILRGALEQGLEEAGQETGQGLAERMALANLQHPEMDYLDLAAEALKDPTLWEQGGIGALVGAIMGGGGAVLTTRPGADVAFSTEETTEEEKRKFANASRAAGNLIAEDRQRAETLALKLVPSRKDVAGIPGIESATSAKERARFSWQLRAQLDLEEQLQAREGEPEHAEGIRSDQRQPTEPGVVGETGEADRGGYVQQAPPGPPPEAAPQAPTVPVEEAEPYARTPVLGPSEAPVEHLMPTGETMAGPEHPGAVPGTTTEAEIPVPRMMSIKIDPRQIAQMDQSELDAVIAAVEKKKQNRIRAEEKYRKEHGGKAPIFAGASPDMIQADIDALRAYGENKFGQAPKATLGAKKPLAETVAPVPAAEPERLRLGAMRQVPEEAVPPVEPPPSPPSTTAPAPQVTSIKNAQVDEERRRRGLPPAMEAGRRSFGTVWDEAMAEIEANPSAEENLLEKLRTQPHNVTDTEDALLLHKQIDLQNQYDLTVAKLAQVQESGTSDQKKDLEDDLAKLERQLIEIYDLGKLAGTAAGRGLNARKMLANESFELVPMTRQLIAAQGGKPLSSEQQKIIKELSERNKKLTAELDALQAKLKAAEPEKVVDRLIKETKKKRPSKVSGVVDRVLAVLDQRADAAAIRLREKLAHVTAGIDPTMIGDLAEIGAKHLAHKVVDFGRWSSTMVEQWGERIRPHLEAVFAESKKILAAVTDAETKKVSKKTRRAVKERLGETKAEITKQEILLKIENKVAKDQEAEIGPLAQKLAKLFIEDGIDEREALLDAVHAELEKIIPDITRRQTMDAISGYGQFAALPKDEISIRLRDFKGQYQQVAKLEDMQKGQAPLKTGVERRTPSDEERRLIQEVNEAKRRGGFVVSDPATQLKTALDAVKTRLKHEIADLAYQIESRTRIVKEKTALPEDAELNKLRKRRDDLKRRFDDIFERKGISDEKRLKMAMESVRRSIVDLQRRIAEGDIEPKPRVSKTPQTAGLVALKAQRDALRDRLKELRALAKPQLDPDELSNRAYQARTSARIAELERRIAEGDFEPRKKREFPLDVESLRLQRELDRVKQQWAEAKFKARMKARTPIEKGFGLVTETWRTIRAILTSMDLSALGRQGVFVALAHPARAARSIPAMLKSFRSKEYALQVQQEIRNRPNYTLYRQAKLFLSEHQGPLTQLEEVYMSRWASRIPGVAGSERAYTAFLNKLRADSFDAMVATLTLDGDATLPEAKAIANFINQATGRGTLGRYEQAGDFFNHFFFAPRYVMSRFNLLFGQSFYRGSARTRLLVAKEYARFLIGTGLVYGLATLAGFDIEWDPRSGEFAKIRFGDTTIDPMGGLIQATTFVARIALGQTKTTKGQVRQIRRTSQEKRLGFGTQTAWDVITRFGRTKLSPQIGAIIDIASGEDLTWQYATPKTVVGRVITPISIQDIAKAIEEEGVAKGSALGIAAIFGFSLQTYDNQSQGKSRLGQRRSATDIYKRE